MLPMHCHLMPWLLVLLVSAVELGQEIAALPSWVRLSEWVETMVLVCVLTLAVLGLAEPVSWVGLKVLVIPRF